MIIHDVRFDDESDAPVNEVFINLAALVSIRKNAAGEITMLLNSGHGMDSAHGGMSEYWCKLFWCKLQESINNKPPGITSAGQKSGDEHEGTNKNTQGSKKTRQESR